MAKWKPDEMLLREYRKHISYELYMLDQTYEKLEKSHGQVINNALIESFCIHARNLIEFYRGTGRKDYIKAEHYTGGSYKPKYVAAYTKHLDAKLYEKLNQQVAHLSRDRTTDPEKKIDRAARTKIKEALTKETALFLSNAKEEFGLGVTTQDVPRATIQTSDTPAASSMVTSATTVYDRSSVEDADH